MYSLIGSNLDLFRDIKKKTSLEKKGNSKLNIIHLKYPILACICMSLLNEMDKENTTMSEQYQSTNRIHKGTIDTPDTTQIQSNLPTSLDCPFFYCSFGIL